MPSLLFQSMTTLPSSELKKKMDSTDILSYPLLQWYVIAKKKTLVKDITHGKGDMSYCSFLESRSITVNCDFSGIL